MEVQSLMKSFPTNGPPLAQSGEKPHLWLNQDRRGPISNQKKPKIEEENTGDPFGFDSDDESLPVSSKNLAKGSSYTESSEAAQLEEVTSVLEANSKMSHVMGEDSVVSDKCLRLEDTLLGKEKSTNRVLEDDASRSSCAKLMTSGKF